MKPLNQHQLLKLFIALRVFLFFRQKELGRPHQKQLAQSKFAWLFLPFPILLIGIFTSCKKETDQTNIKLQTNQRNHAPFANAGVDQTITLPASIVALDGSHSTDLDNNITTYLWTKISGPSSFTIKNANAVQTQVSNLTQGVYQFELKVTDATRMTGKDTVKVQVLANADSSSPPPCKTNCGRIVFVSDRDGNNEIYSCSPDGSNVTRLTNDAADDGDPVWSPDGTRIAFVRGSSIFYGFGDIYIMNADGSNVVQQTFIGDVTHPTWAPDGTRIAFTNNGSNSVFVMNLASRAVSELQYAAGENIVPHPNWSPDGTKIAFESEGNPNLMSGDIFTISPDGSGRTLILYGDPNYIRPAWSPDGTSLSVSISNTVGSIGVMNADGTGLGIIRSGLVTEFYVGTRTSWSPDGTDIAYTENKTIKWVAADGSASGTIITNGWDADWTHH